VAEVVVAVTDLAHTLVEPSAFFVRLLDAKDPNFEAVSRFFEEVVGPVVKALGYQPVVMGEGQSIEQWMNVEIFERLGRAHMAVVDLTGNRANCYMELGFAYGRGMRVLLSAEQSTEVPFDAKMIERHSWASDFEPARQRDAFGEYALRHPAGLPLVREVRL
jgi:hypothetical protein